MFAQRKTSATDAAAAARRRLEALAAEFATAQTVQREARQGTERAGRAWSSDVGEPRGHVSPHPPASLATVDPTDVDSLDPVARAASGGDPTGGVGTSGRHREQTTLDRPGVRLGLTTHHLLVAALVVIALLVVAAWRVVQAMPHAEPVSVSNVRSVPPASTTSTFLGTSPASTPSGGVPGSGPPVPSGGIVVDVTGKVRRPGIVELPAGARVIDAIKEAGGVKPGADTSELNLARLLVDGEQVVVGLEVPAIAPPSAWSPTAAAPTGAMITPVNLNTATQAELETLPGIGPVTAQAILAWRTDNGAFTTVEELLEVSGIGDKTLADLAPYVYV